MEVGWLGLGSQSVGLKRDPWFKDAVYGTVAFVSVYTVIELEKSELRLTATQPIR